MKNYLNNYFGLHRHQTDIKTEVIAGLTTFSTMAYIIIVNPLILSATGMNFDAVMFATIISASIATLIMGLWANYPFALSPGMGLNAYFTYSLVLGFGHSWEVALGAAFISGVILLLLTLFHVRQAVMNAIPVCLRLSVASGVGLFLAFIGLKNVGLIAPHAHTFVAMGNIASHQVLFAGLGVLLIGVLMNYRFKGAIFISIVIVWLLSLVLGFAEWKGLVALPPNPSATFLKLDILGALRPELLSAVVSFLFIAIFDTAGTLLGLGEQGNFLDSRGRLPRANRALLPDAIGTITGSLTGTSTLTTYLESASGIAVGGKTGLTAVVVALLFLLSLFFSPFASSIPQYATAPALIVIGSFMVRQIVKIQWDDPSEFIPAFVVLMTIPLTFSIANGISLGFIMYPLMKLLSDKGKSVPWLTWVLFGLFLCKFIFL